jgi:putative molybdopterin biosynthesis protein
VMVEHTEVDGDHVKVFKPVTPGRGLTYAGTDIAKGETVYRRGDSLTSRETGVLAAIGVSEVIVQRKPKVGIISTGDEIIAPTETMKPGLVYDSNAQVLADAVQELGGEAVRLGIVSDDLVKLRSIISRAVQQCDIILLSGGTSKGAGDISYHVVREFSDPGIVAHGVALKPGKPICLAATQGKPVVILPGFPTSAIFTFHEFVASVILEMAGRPKKSPQSVTAQMAMQINSEIGRTEYLLVGLVRQQDSTGSLTAYPMGKGSGSVTSFARADGFVTIDRHEEIVEEGTPVAVTLLGRDLGIADLVVIGSHCIGLDLLLGEMQQRGLRTKFLAVGSTAGLRAIERGECDLAGIHLLDPKTNTYNKPFLSSELDLVHGYTRQQGIVFRRDDDRFHNRTVDEILNNVVVQPDCVMVNRNQGSGTRVLVDELLAGTQPSGYAVQSRSHNAVAASVAQRRSDWGLAIEIAAKHNDLGFLPIRAEEYDFVIRKDNKSDAVDLFIQVLGLPDVVERLKLLGLDR